MNRHHLLAVLISSLFVFSAGSAEVVAAEPPPPGKAAEPIVPKREEIRFLRIQLTPETASQLAFDHDEITVAIVDHEGIRFKYSLTQPWQWSAIAHEGLYLLSPTPTIQPNQLELHLFPSVNGVIVDRELHPNLLLSVHGVSKDWKPQISDERQATRTVDAVNVRVWPVPATPLIPERVTAPVTDPDSTAAPPEAALAAAPESGQTEDDVLKRIQGQWDVIGFTSNGRKLPSSNTQVIFEKRGLVLRHEGSERIFTISRIDPQQKPAEIDMTRAEDSRVIRGVYKFQGKQRLKFCQSLDGTVYPQELEI